MKHLALAIVFVLLGHNVVARAWDVKNDIRTVINQQLEAFLNDDFEKAFSFATTNIQRIFQSPEGFETMVRRGYPMIHRHKNVEFLELREAADHSYQMLLIEDQQQGKHVIIYLMKQTDQGWRVDGVRVRTIPDVKT